MTTTDSTTTPARAPGTVPTLVLPCNLPCPKCGATDINRLFRGRGTERESEKYGHPISRFESAEAWTAVAWRDHIMHHCRVCQYDWQTPSLSRRRQNDSGLRSPDRPRAGDKQDRVVGSLNQEAKG